MGRRTAPARIAALAAALTLGLAACSESPESADGGSAATDESGPITIGAVLDITGAGASLGVPERQALELRRAPCRIRRCITTLAAPGDQDQHEPQDPAQG